MLSLASQIEAILYLKGQPLDIATLVTYTGCDRPEVESALIDLMTDYAHRDSALEVVETPAGYVLQLRESYGKIVQKMIPTQLGVGALRTLAAIAIKQPISQTDLVDLRGSGAYQHVQELVELGFVRKRPQPNGRSYVLQVTDKFHQNYELDGILASQVVDLPNLTEVENVTQGDTSAQDSLE
jgi:segregation and condensation protein B